MDKQPKYSLKELMSLLERDSAEKNKYSTKSGFIDIYGFDLNQTLISERYQKLFAECKKRGLIQN